MAAILERLFPKRADTVSNFTVGQSGNSLEGNIRAAEKFILVRAEKDNLGPEAAFYGLLSDQIVVSYTGLANLLRIAENQQNNQEEYDSLMHMINSDHSESLELRIQIGMTEPSRILIV